MSLSPVVSAVFLVGLLAGMVGLFMVGFNLLTSVLIRRTGSLGPNILSLSGKTASGTSDTSAQSGTRRLSRFPRLRGFSMGLVASALTGSVVAAVLSVITSADRDKRESGPSTKNPEGLPGISGSSPWVLLGANLGGALACWVPALLLFHQSTFVSGLFLMGFAMLLRLYPTIHGINRADLVTGAALLLIAVDLLAGRAPILHSVSIPGEALQLLSGGALAVPILGLALGLLLAAVTRSTVASVIVITALTVYGILPPTTALFSVAAVNTAPAIAGYYASRPLGAAARGAAGQSVVVATLLLVVGTALALFLTVLLSRNNGLSPGPSATILAIRLTAFHTAIHIVVIPLFALIRKPTDHILRRILAFSDAKADPSRSEPLAFISPGYPDSLDANLVLTRSALARMADSTYEMLMIVINATQVDDEIEEATDRVIDLRGRVNEMEEQILQPLSRSIQLPCSPAQADRIQQQQRIARELSLVGDDCYKTIRLLSRSYRKNLRFHQESRDELFEYTSRILDFLRYNADYLEGKIDRPDWDIANGMEETIDRLRDKLKKRSRKVLEKGDNADIRGELTFIDIVSHLEHVGDRCLSIAETVRRLSRS